MQSQKRSTINAWKELGVAINQWVFCVAWAQGKRGKAQIFETLVCPEND
jgi:hypothetical protein